MFDAHNHLQFCAFDEDREAVIRAARDTGVRGMLLAGYDDERRALAAELAATTPGIWATCGVHPWAVADLGPQGLPTALKDLENALEDRSFCGIGELGMDFFRARSEEERGLQKKAFVAQLGMARERNLPVVIHAVRCHNSLLQILRAEGMPEAGGMMHGYSGSPRQVGNFLMANLDISLGTPLLWGDPRSMEVARQCPADRLLIETDAPDRAPRERGGRNEPAVLAEILSALAELSHTSERELREITEKNTRQRFALGEATL